MISLEDLRQAKLKRRIIPFSLSFIAMGVATVPIWTNWITEAQADRWTLIYLTFVFGFKALVFTWMRHRMKLDDHRELTIFGQALIDFFTGLIALSWFFAIGFAVLYWYTIQGRLQPFSVRQANRAAIGATGTLIILTGLAVIYEMHRTRGRLVVHRDGDSVEPIPEGELR